MTIIDVPAELGLGWWQWRARVKRDPCAWCGVKPSTRKATIEHIEPKSCGGADDPSNIVGACGPDNWQRHHTSLLLYLLERTES